MRWMRAGVTVVDPASTWVHASVDLAPDVTLLPGTSLEGATSVAAGATIGPDTTLVDVEVGEGATVVRTHGSLAVDRRGRERRAVRLPPTGHRARRARQDRHVRGDQERPDRRRRQGAAPDLRRRRRDRRGREHRRRRDLRQLRRRHEVADARSGGRASSAATRPWSRRSPSRTARTSGAGSTVTGDVGAGELAVSRGRQRNVPGWVARKRAGTKTAAAAAGGGRSGRERSRRAPSSAGRHRPSRPSTSCPHR